MFGYHVIVLLMLLLRLIAVGSPIMTDSCSSSSSLCSCSCCCFHGRGDGSSSRFRYMSTLFMWWLHHSSSRIRDTVLWGYRIIIIRSRLLSDPCQCAHCRSSHDCDVSIGSCRMTSIIIIIIGIVTTSARFIAFIFIICICMVTIV